MSLANDLGLDTAPDAAEVEKAMSGGGIPAEGLHHALLVGTREGEATNGSKFRELTFEILAGPSKGKTVKESLWSPKGEDAEKDEKTRNRIRLFARRLGMLTTAKDPNTGKERLVQVAGLEDFIDVVDRAACVIDVKHETYQKTQGKGGEGKKATLTFEGILPVDDKRVAAAKVPLGKVPTASASKAAGGGKAKDKFGDV